MSQNQRIGSGTTSCPAVYTRHLFWLRFCFVQRLSLFICDCRYVALGAFLLIGIHNAWDTVTYSIVVDQPRVHSKKKE